MATTEIKLANSNADQSKMDWKAFITPYSSKEGRM